MGIYCRVCGKLLDTKNKLIISPAPAGAQYFLESVEKSNNDVIDLVIVQCEFCGLVQGISPVVKYFRSVITAAGLSPQMREHRTLQVHRFSEYYSLKGKKVLEVGCNYGYFLDILFESGLIPYGTDWWADDRIKDSRIYNHYPSHGHLIQGSPYDAFFCLNFLEHSPSPIDFLTGIRENLSVDAIGLIEVPNYAQQQKQRRISDYIADHLSYFDSDTISTTVSLSGFSIEKIHETRGGENIEIWVRNRSRKNFCLEQQIMELTYKNLDDWISNQKRDGKKVAIWGASHQALTILSRIKGEDEISIFDSAPFKQGKFSPVSHLKIIRPDEREISILDSILIIASGYENEIKKTLIENLNFKGLIYSLKGENLVRI